MSRARVVCGLAAVACLTLSLLALAGAYAWFKDRAVSEARRRGLPAYTANSIKHAFAASESYSWLRLAGVPRGFAGQLVYRLGQANEWVEFYGRWPTARDPTREIYKDLYNNTAGVAAAARLDDRGRSSTAERLALIGEMTIRGIVLHSYLDDRVPATTDGDDPIRSDLHLALARFKGDRAAHSTTINKSI